MCFELRIRFNSSKQLKFKPAKFNDQTAHCEKHWHSVEHKNSNDIESFSPPSLLSLSYSLSEPT